MRKFLLLIAMVASLGIAAAPAAMAQDNVDVETASESVLSADLESLIADMETPPSDDALPEGFSGATYLDPEEATSEQGALPATDLEGSEGSVAYTLTYEPGGAASPEASAEGAAFAVRIASVNYVFIDEEITSDDLEDFKEGAEEGIAADDEGEATVEDIQIGGADAILLTYSLEDGGIQSVVNMVAVPVGNTMVIGMVVEAGETVDTEGLQTATEDLTLASIAHLGETAEGGQ